MYFQYGEAETAYLSARDERMAAVIAQAGHIEREVDTDLFSAVVHHIVGQQISTKAQATIWKRMLPSSFVHVLRRCSFLVCAAFSPPCA